MYFILLYRMVVITVTRITVIRDTIRVEARLITGNYYEDRRSHPPFLAEIARSSKSPVTPSRDLLTPADDIVTTRLPRPTLPYPATV